MKKGGGKQANFFLPGGMQKKQHSSENRVWVPTGRQSSLILFDLDEQMVLENLRQGSFTFLL